MSTVTRRAPLALAALTAVACMCTGTAWAADSTAGAGHRARLSADLQDHLNANSQSIDAIVHGTRATCDALARTYGLVVSRYLTTDGCVFRLTAGQLAALQQDREKMRQQLAFTKNEMDQKIQRLQERIQQLTEAVLALTREVHATLGKR